MTRRRKPLRVENKLVVAFDICSSSNIIEDLSLTQNLRAIRNMLIALKTFLHERARALNFEIYKFTGDGWILLFPPQIGAKPLMKFLTKLSIVFQETFYSKIHPLLEKRIRRVGMTFGVDRGNLVRIVMTQKVEYIGRPLNIACRLQSAVKDKDKNPQYKVLISRHVFSRYSTALRKYKPENVKRDLRNIRDGKDFQCVKLHLPLRKAKK